MASFLSGPAAQLVGAGMQAIGVGIPVGETSAKVINGLRECGLPVPPKTWFKRKDAGGNGSAQERARDAEPSSKTIYDKLESHLNGVIQVVKPAIEIKKLLRENCCRSAERPSRRASSQSPAGDRSMYYTPQKCSSGARNLFSDEESPSPRKRRAPPKKPASKCDKRRGCSRRVGISSSDDEEEHCMYCSRSRSLLKLPCGRLICSKCDETGDHESESNMPRPRNQQTAKQLTNPVAVIDLTQDSPSNAALRLSRVQTRRNEEESDGDCSDGDDVVIPLDDSTEDSDGVEDVHVQRRNKTAIVINLEDTVEEKPSAKTRAKQAVLNDSPNKKGGLCCPICFESLADDNMTPMSTPCGHVYCLECLKKVSQAKKKCALCQRSITLGKCIRLHI